MVLPLGQRELLTVPRVLNLDLFYTPDVLLLVYMSLMLYMSLITSSNYYLEYMWKVFPVSVVASSMFVALSFSSITCFRMVRGLDGPDRVDAP